MVNFYSLPVIFLWPARNIFTANCSVVFMASDKLLLYE